MEETVNLGLDPTFAQDPLLSEDVNEKLVEEHIKTKFDVEEQQSEPAEFTEGGLNALRYAAGFVPWKLKQNFKKPTCKYYVQDEKGDICLHSHPTVKPHEERCCLLALRCMRNKSYAESWEIRILTDNWC